MSSTTQYYMRAFDSGGRNVWVYWTTPTPATTPSPSITNPSYTGVLTSPQVVFSFQQATQGFGGIVFQNFTPLTALLPKVIMTWSKASTQPPLSYKLHLIKYEKGITKAFDPSTDMLIFSGSSIQVG